MVLRPEWNDNRQLVLENKYLNDGEKDWNDVVERLQKASGLNDENDLIKNFDFVPAGRILRNLGSEHKDKTFFNCYVLNFEDVGDGRDSRSGIMDLFRRVFEISARGGGVGIPFNVLRPKESTIKGVDGTSTGPISWMEAFDGLVSQISQQKRRGAYLIGMSPWHPDIFNFISVKSDLDKINNANLSLLVSNDFMKAVKKDEDWHLEFPDTTYKYYDDEWDGDLKAWKEKDYPIIHYDTVKAREIFNLATDYAHKNGEPGIIFLERANLHNIPNQDEKIISTNPCFTGDMELLTKEGYKKFEDLSGSNAQIIGISGKPTNGKVWFSGEKEVIELNLSINGTIKCTPDHEFMTETEEMVEAKDLKDKKLIPDLHLDKDGIQEKFIKLGFIQHRGQLDSFDKDSNSIIMNLEENDGYTLIKVFKNDEYTKDDSEMLCELKGYNGDVIDYGFTEKDLSGREFPEKYNSWTYDQKRSFLRGCYTANGKIINDSISYKTPCKEFANKLANTLENIFNIDIHTTEEIQGSSKVYRVDISDYRSILKFIKNIGFCHLHKRKDLSNLAKERAPKIMSINDLGVKKVYDFNEPMTNKGYVNGFVASNCGEIVLSENTVCNLGSINLVNMVNKDRSTNWNKLEKAILYGVEFLDKIVDLNPYYLDSVEEKQKWLRKIGLGIMGWADYLILKNIKYGSKESISEAHEVWNFIKNTAFAKSALLAKEKGAAPVWKDYMLNNKYIQSLDERVYELVEKYGLRNTGLTTIPPTGSTSMLAGVSSGLEPNFAFTHTRSDSLGERTINHWILEQSIDVDDEVLVESSDIPAKDHVKMQASMQEHITSSVSKTINAPKSASKQDTRDAFMLAYDTGCKGITYYRDGSRTGVLRKEEKKEREEEVSELERMFKEAGDEVIKDKVTIPKQPPAKVFKRKDKNGKKWYFIVTFADRDRKRPFALFVKTNNYAKGDVASWTISEMEKLLYDQGIAKDLVRDQIEKYSGQSNADKIARVIGMALRHNIQIKEIVDVLDSCEPDFSSLLFHIKKLLERYIPDGTELSEKCPECDADLIYLEGCKSCSSCSWSACG